MLKLSMKMLRAVVSVCEIAIEAVPAVPVVKAVKLQLNLVKFVVIDWAVAHVASAVAVVRLYTTEKFVVMALLPLTLKLTE